MLTPVIKVSPIYSKITKAFIEVPRVAETSERAEPMGSGLNGGDQGSFLVAFDA